MRKNLIYLLLLFIIANSCNQNVDKQNKPISAFDNRVIQKLLPTKQEFKITGKSDTVIISNSGSLIIIDSLTFEDYYGNVIKDKIDIIVYEAINISEILKANLSTVGESGVLESDGMIFINALHDSIQLKVRDRKKMTVFLQNNSLKPNMSLWYGNSNENTIIWTEKDSIIQYLTLIDLEQLDFSFESASRTYKFVGKIAETPSGLTEAEAVKEWLIVRDTLTINDYNTLQDIPSIVDNFQEFGSYETVEMVHQGNCGIPIKYINLLKDKKFQNTLIATKEFEYRMKIIHRTCDVEVLKIYINNLDLNLWEIDKLVYEYLVKGESKYAHLFDKFAKQRLTKVKENKKLSNALRKTLKSIDDMLESDKELSRVNAEKFKRNSIFYQFNARKLGWYNIDRYWKRPDLDKISLNVIVPEIKNIDKIQIHLSIPEDKVVIPLSKKEKNTWRIVSDWEPKLPIENKGLISGVIINNSGEFFIINKEFIIKEENIIEVKVNKSDIDKVIETYDLVVPKIIKPENKSFDCCKSLEQADYSDSLVLGE